MIKITKSMGILFTQLQFVLKARMKSERHFFSNPVLMTVFVDEENIVCTDTRRIHLIPVTEFKELLEPGYYEVVKENKSEIILNKVEMPEFIFPEYKKYFPEEEEKKFICEVKADNSGKNNRISKAIYSIYNNCNLYLNLNLVNDAIPDDDTMKVYCSGELIPKATFEGTDKIALVMSLKIK